MPKQNDSLVDWLCRAYGLRLDRAQADAIEIVGVLARDGYALVPVEPTQQQIEAVTHNVVHKENGGLEWGIAAAYRAMVAAVQTP